jgi:glyoxylase I family protein
MIGKNRIGTIVYFVSDITRTKEFYSDVIGLEVKPQPPSDDGLPWMIAQTDGGVELVFFQMESTRGTSPIVVFDLPDGGIDAAVAELARRGATIVTPVSHSPGGWSAEIADPDGHVLSMYQTDSVPR